MKPSEKSIIIEGPRTEIKRPKKPELTKSADSQNEESAREGSEKVARFNDTVEVAYIQSGAKEFFETFEKITRLSSPEQSTQVELTPEEINDILSFADSLDEKYRDTFRDWINRQLGEPGSTVGKMAQDIAKANLAKSIINDEERDDALIKFIHNERGSATFPDINDRMEALYDMLDSLAEKSPTDDIIAAFFIDLCNEMSDDYATRPLGLKEKILGRKVPNIPEIAGTFFSKSYAMNRHGKTDVDNQTYFEANVMNRLRIDAKTGKLLPQEAVFSSAVNGIIHKMKETINGATFAGEEITDKLSNVEGVDEYAQANDLGGGFAKAIEALAPITCDKRLISEVNFRNVSDINSLGQYDPSSLEVVIFKPHEQLSALEITKTVAHECGHAMRPEKYLPLPEAYKWQLGMIATCQKDFSGFLTAYSAQAREMYAKRLSAQMRQEAIHPLAVSQKTRANIEVSHLIEEWAEMCGYAVAVPHVLKAVCPEKYWLTEKTCGHLGFNIELISQEVGKALAEEESK